MVLLAHSFDGVTYAFYLVRNDADLLCLGNFFLVAAKDHHSEGSRENRDVSNVERKRIAEATAAHIEKIGYSAVKNAVNDIAQRTANKDAGTDQSSAAKVLFATPALDEAYLA